MTSDPGDVHLTRSFFFLFFFQVECRMKSDEVGYKQALRSVRLDRLIEDHGSMEKGLFYVLSSCPYQSEVPQAAMMSSVH